MGYLSNYLDRKPLVRVVSSHHMPFNPEYSASALKYRYVIMLRKPVERALSVYRYEVIQPAVSLGSKMAKSLSMQEYFKWRMQEDSPPVIRSFFTRVLASYSNPGHEPGEQDYDAALSRSRLENVFVGFVERFDESMVLFESGLKDEFPELDLTYIKQNQNSHPGGDSLGVLQQELGEELFSRLQYANQMDQRLYDQVLTEFESRTASIPGFGERVDKFRTRCADLNSRKYFG